MDGLPGEFHHDARQVEDDSTSESIPTRRRQAALVGMARGGVAGGSGTFRYPAELTRPKAHPEQKRGRRAKTSHDEINERPNQ